ncbi:NUMOD4 domain-containing protein [Sphingobium sp. YR768]|uniref:NUMOD4 domain-containing protein n=1 Tax=Sphingobium sp. YR768 TaxID=1884365 RepID=UPI000B84EE40|nr:NUMOD4 domain-containing protein [Sphingobium sp. YR768]
MTTPEEWRDIPGWEGLYQASSLGRIRSLPRNVVRGSIRGRTKIRILTAGIKSTGYPHVTLTAGESEVTIAVHRLVCSAFHGTAPKSTSQVAHRDGTRINNKPENLRWVSAKENAEDRHSHGRTVKGARHHNLKYSDEQVSIVRRLKSEGKTYSQIAEFVGCSRSQAFNIVKHTQRK